jgi:hypothetical protein
MVMRTSFYFIVSLALLVMVLIPSPLRADDASNEQPIFDSALVEIVLERNGVWALDSSGYEWHYDFALERFLPGPQDPVDIDRLRRMADGMDVDDDGFPKRTVAVDAIMKLDRGSVTIAENEWVDGDVIAWERVTIKGWVKGDVISYQNRVLVTRTGQVDGDVKAPRVIIREGGEVNGEIIEEAFGIGNISAPFSKEGLIVAIVFSGLAILGTLILVPLMPRQVKAVSDCAVNFKGRCFAIGFLLWPGMALVFVLLVITIVGVLLIPLVPLLYLLAILLGFIAYGATIGRAILGLVGGKRSYLVQSLIGVTILMAPWPICGYLMGGNDPTAYGFGIFILVMSNLVTIFVGCCGIGAAFLTRFGFRPYKTYSTHGAGSAPAPAPPPIPEPPSFSPPPEPMSPKSGETRPDPIRNSGQERSNPDQE